MSKINFAILIIALIALATVPGVSATTALPIHEQLLKNGWNEIVIPNDVKSMTPQEYVQGINGVLTVWHWDGSNWKLFDPVMPEQLNTLLAIEPGKLYSVHIDYPTDQIKTLVLATVIESAVFSDGQFVQILEPGWNKISLPEGGTITPEYFASVFPDIDVIWTYNPSTLVWELYDPVMPHALNTLSLLKAGELYYVYFNSIERQEKVIVPGKPLCDSFTDATSADHIVLNNYEQTIGTLLLNGNSYSINEIDSVWQISGENSSSITITRITKPENGGSGIWKVVFNNSIYMFGQTGFSRLYNNLSYMDQEIFDDSFSLKLPYCKYIKDNGEQKIYLFNMTYNDPLGNIVREAIFGNFPGNEDVSVIDVEVNLLEDNAYNTETLGTGTMTLYMSTSSIKWSNKTIPFLGITWMQIFFDPYNIVPGPTEINLGTAIAKSVVRQSFGVVAKDVVELGPGGLKTNLLNAAGLPEVKSVLGIELESLQVWSLLDQLKSAPADLVKKITLVSGNYWNVVGYEGKTVFAVAPYPTKIVETVAVTGRFATEKVYVVIDGLELEKGSQMAVEAEGTLAKELKKRGMRIKGEAVFGVVDLSDVNKGINEIGIPLESSYLKQGQVSRIYAEVEKIT